MEHKGMVHALESIKGLLKPGGTLIDIHPVEAGQVQVRRGDEVLFAESDPGYDTDGSLQRADEALEQVIRRRVYLNEAQVVFDVITYASTAPEMQAYWAKYEAYDEGAQDEAIVVGRNEIYGKANEITRSVPDAEVSYHERVQITRLRPLPGRKE